MFLGLSLFPLNLHLRYLQVEIGCLLIQLPERNIQGSRVWVSQREGEGAEMQIRVTDPALSTRLRCRLHAERGKLTERGGD